MIRSIYKKVSMPALVCFIVLMSAPSHAQRIERTTRKKIYSVDPSYPDMLKRSKIGGVVRLMVVISPRGTVATVNQLGGNAALVEAAVTAVKKWKYTPADLETTQEVSITFDPHSYE